jgi:hypothetical protein
VNLRNGDVLKAQQTRMAARQALEVKPQAHQDGLLRGNPRFEKVLASLASKETASE